MAKWAHENQYPFEVWTDDTHQLAVAYGAAPATDAVRPKRVTVVLDEKGDVLLQYPSASFSTNPLDVLEDLRALSPSVPKP